jgi:inner membrane protein
VAGPEQALGMDSLTHIVLGAAIGTAVLGRKAGPRAALWGAACATLPDLDVLVPYGDPVRDFTFHRAHSHALFWLTLASPLLALLMARLHRAVGARFRDWWLLAWLSLISHALLDAFTVYGTQLLLPFSDYPVGVGSVFIIDPLFTLPLIIGVVAALVLQGRRPDLARRWNTVGLAWGAAYLGWSVAAQAHVESVVNRSLAATPLVDSRVLVTPAPFTTLLWRVVVMDDDGYHEGYRSLLDDDPAVRLEHHATEVRLLEPLRQDWTVQRLAWFSKGFYSVGEAPRDLAVARGSASSLRQLIGVVDTASAAVAVAGPGAVPLVMTDLRMGQTPWFVFSFVVAEHDATGVRAVPPRQVPTQRPPMSALSWLWQRIWNGDRA